MEAYIHEAVADGDRFVVRFSGCDYKCRYCNVPHLVEFQTGETMGTKEVKALLDAASCTVALFTGGEPLLQRQALAELLRHCKGRGMRTIVDTNASKPDALRALLDEGLVDELIIDVKAPAASFGRVTQAATFFKPAGELFREFSASLALLKGRREAVTLTFRTLITPGILYRKEEILAIASMLDGLDAEWLLAPFSPEVTLDPALGGVAPPTPKFLENLASFVRKEHPGLRVSVAEK